MDFYDRLHAFSQAGEFRSFQKRTSKEGNVKFLIFYICGYNFVAGELRNSFVSKLFVYIRGEYKLSICYTGVRFCS